MIGAASGRTQKPPWLSNLVICFGLTSLIWLVFGQTLGHQFVAYDDQNYVYENPIVTGGFTANGLRAAFTQSYSSNSCSCSIERIAFQVRAWRDFFERKEREH